jgi:hypothetical protein
MITTQTVPQPQGWALHLKQQDTPSHLHATPNEDVCRLDIPMQDGWAARVQVQEAARHTPHQHK